MYWLVLRFGMGRVAIFHHEEELIQAYFAPCIRKECQCPKDKVDTGTGQCIPFADCTVQERKKRQVNNDPLALYSPAVRDILCIIRNNCPTTTTANPPAACGANQRRYVCGTACEPTCATPNPTCTQQCISNVCQCSEGYIRYTGLCIPKYACPNSHCPTYQTYAQCVPCERVCNSQYFLCYQYCVPGCTCQSGYVRDTVTNNCISSYYCPQLYQGYNRYAVYGQNSAGR
ncbi:hypothetical protein Aduo_011380 [Ancylostoma duodenale]